MSEGHIHKMECIMSEDQIRDLVQDIADMVIGLPLGYSQVHVLGDFEFTLAIGQGAGGAFLADAVKKAAETREDTDYEIVQSDDVDAALDKLHRRRKDLWDRRN